MISEPGGNYQDKSASPAHVNREIDPVRIAQRRRRAVGAFIGILTGSNGYLTDISRYQLISLENCGFYYNQCLCSFSIVDNRIDTAR